LDITSRSDGGVAFGARERAEEAAKATKMGLSDFSIGTKYQ